MPIIVETGGGPATTTFNGVLGTGWAQYNDGAGAQAFAADTRTQFTNDKSALALEPQLPTDVETFWADNKIQGQSGDDCALRVQFVATPNDATCSEVFIEVDIGGAQNAIDRKRIQIVSGSGVAQEVSENFELYSLDTFEANGGTIYLTFDGPVTVTGKTVLVKRGHKAR